MSAIRYCRICKLSLRTEWAWENLLVHKSCLERAIEAAIQARREAQDLKGVKSEHLPRSA